MTSTKALKPMTREQAIAHARRRANAIRDGRSIETRAFVGDAIDAYLDRAIASGDVPDAFALATQLTPRRSDGYLRSDDCNAVQDALWECQLELRRAR